MFLTLSKRSKQRMLTLTQTNAQVLRLQHQYIQKPQTETLPWKCKLDIEYIIKGE